MPEFEMGDRVRIDIPDEADPDFQSFHGRHGEVVDVLTDDASAITGREEDAVLYRVRFRSGDVMDFRTRDLRPPLDD